MLLPAKAACDVFAMPSSQERSTWHGEVEATGALNVDFRNKLLGSLAKSHGEIERRIRRWLALLELVRARAAAHARTRLSVRHYILTAAAGPEAENYMALPVAAQPIALIAPSIVEPLTVRYHGCYSSSGLARPFKAAIKWNRTRYYLGSFPTAKQAARAYDWAARLINDHRPLNFAPDEHLGDEPSNEGARRLRAAVRSRTDPRIRGHREYVGCSLNKNSGKINAQIMWGGKKHNLGSYRTALEAAKAYDWAARQLGDRPLNLPPSADLGEPPRCSAAERLRAFVREQACHHAVNTRARGNRGALSQTKAKGPGDVPRGRRHPRGRRQAQSSP
ncbi:hypothetical protein KFE25_000215 [Diacronema lutheri]|uniref:AP2/ERF domain-containing protein n=1 Tax=Diacronema lutheri TaxID=2081491 RepID=A0A8J6C706_DIALT|nr:hypothetical protein KFE25_000215 [Diacronema lutheri]